MKASEIPRLAVDKFSKEINEERLKLAQRAEKDLGYKRLLRALKPGALLSTLRELDIEPLSTSKVASYQSSKRKTGMWSGTKIGISTLVANLISVPAAVYAVDLALGDPGKTATPLHLAMGWTTTLVAIALASFCVIWGIAEGWSSGTKRLMYWESCALPYYEGNVPEFVLQKALLIKEKLPRADLHVEFLVEKVETRKKDFFLHQPDPFFVVRYEGEVAYIDVWDETDYEL